jgi:hypothetical protein
MSDTAPYRKQQRRVSISPSAGPVPGVRAGATPSRGVPRAPVPAPLPGAATLRNQSATQPLPVGPRRWGRWLMVAALALAVVAGRVLHDSWASLRAGQAAEASGPEHRAAAIRHYLRSARMYVPGSPFVNRSLDHLRAIADRAGQAGDRQGEREALEAIRSGLLGARSLYTPHGDRLLAVNERLAVLYAAIEDPAVAPGASVQERESWHRQRLAVTPGPAVPATLAALGGMALWLGAVVVFIRRGLDRTLRLERRWALGAAVGFVIGLTLFVAGLRLA